MKYDELVKKLRYCGNSVSCLHCPYWVGCGGSKEDLIQAADAIEELRKAVLRLEDESGLYDELPTFYIHWMPHFRSRQRRSEHERITDCCPVRCERGNIEAEKEET